MRVPRLLCDAVAVAPTALRPPGAVYTALQLIPLCGGVDGEAGRGGLRFGLLLLRGATRGTSEFCPSA